MIARRVGVIESLEAMPSRPPSPLDFCNREMDRGWGKQVM